CTSLVALLDVPLAKSAASISNVRYPRAAASTAVPSPVAPPPITMTSQAAGSFKVSSRAGRLGMGWEAGVGFIRERRSAYGVDKGSRAGVRGHGGRGVGLVAGGGDFAAHAGFLQCLGKGFLRPCVGKEAVDLRNVRQFDHGLSLELAAVGGQPDFAGLFDDAARHAHFAEVVVAQRAVGFDARNGDQADVDLELADEVDGGFAHDAAVARPHDAAGDDDFAVGVVRQDVRHVQVVGNDPQAAVVQQGARNGFGGGADVQDQRTAVGQDRKSTRLNSSHVKISYAVFCL